MFRWTAALEPFAHPVRGQGTALAPAPLDDKKLVAALKQAPELAERLKAAPTFADEARAFLWLAGDLERIAPLLDRWIARYGAAGALDIFTQVPNEPGIPLMPPARAASVEHLRRYLAHASDYAAALDFVTSHDHLPYGMPAWSGSQYHLGREALAFLFPDHRPLFDLAVGQLVERNFTCLYLLGAVATDDDFQRLGGRIGYGDWERNAVTLARALEDAALPHLTAYTARSTKVYPVARALTAYVSSEAAVALADYIIEKPPAIEILRGYFTAHPELAAEALEPLVASKKKKVRETAATLLAASRAS